MFFTMLVSFSILGLINGVGVYYAKYLLADSQLIGLINMAFALPLVMVLMCSAYLLKMMTRLTVIIVGMATLIIGSIIMAVATHDTYVAIIETKLRGAGLAPIMVNAYSLLANTYD